MTHILNYIVDEQLSHCSNFLTDANQISKKQSLKKTENLYKTDKKTTN